jgi:hypothetical protein
MDSLMAVELQVAIESQFGVTIPAMAINEETSIVQLAGQIAKQLDGNGAAGPGDDSPEPDADRDTERAILASLSALHGEGLTLEELETLADDVADSRRSAQ